MKTQTYLLALSVILLSLISTFVQAQDGSYLSPNMYSEGTQIERIQRAINDAASSTGKVVIPKFDVVENTNVWLIDEAILLPGNIELELNNCKIKLSDSCRDN